MTGLQYAGRLTVGGDDLDFGLCDLTVMHGTSGEVILIAVSRQGGNVFAWDASGSGSPVLIDQQSVGAVDSAGEQASLTVIDTDVGPRTVVTGIGTDGMVASGVSPTGELQPLSSISAGSGGWLAVTQVGAGRVAAADSNGTGVTLFDTTAGGDVWGVVGSIEDTDNTYASAITLMAGATVGGSDIVLVASPQEAGVTSYVVTPTGLLEGGSVGRSDGNGLMVPMDMAVVMIGDRAFGLVASATDGSGAITVLELHSDGALTQVDHVFDTLDTRFGSVQSLAVSNYRNGALIVAGGGDGGLALLMLSKDGWITHLHSFEDTTASGLTNVVAVEMLITGDVVRVFVTSQADAGISVFNVDLAGFGDVFSDTNGSGTVNGSSGDDVLVETSGADTLNGKSGADIFVITEDDANEDVILSFDPSEDRIDLSSWSMLYDVGSLSIWSTGTGARIQYRDQLLSVYGMGNQPIGVNDLRKAIEIDLNRLPTPSQITRMGDNADNIVEGSWGMDTLSGAGGNDTIFGYDGDDVFVADAGDDEIFGGNGSDTITFAGGIADVAVSGNADEGVTITGGLGRDVIHGVETFVFEDSTVTLATLLGDSGSEPDPAPEPVVEPPVPVDVIGTSGPDALEYLAGPAHVTGYGGDDELSTGASADTINGGMGHDVIKSGQGNDSIVAGGGDDQVWAEGDADIVSGGAGNDVLRGGRGADVVYGNDGDDILRGQRDGDTLYGGAGDDNIKGGGGNDVHYGEGGSDYIKGGTRKDTLYGGDGDDTLSGNSFDDVLYGDDGDDLLRSGGGDDFLGGGRGNDVLKGGGGADQFEFNAGDGADRILDFEVGIDTLALSGSLLNDAQTVQDVVDSFVVQTSDGVLFNFGGLDAITMDGVTDIAALMGSIDLGG